MVAAAGAQTRPLVSVIIATYNRSDTLRLTLRSVLNQELSDFEVWVVGDACTDDSASVVASFNDERLHWLNLKRNSGNQALPNNVGLRQARGKYVAYLGHDDLWLPGHLANLVAAISATGAAMVHDICVRIGPAGVVNCAGQLPQNQTYEHFSVPPSCWLHRRDLIDEIGLWRDPNKLAHTVDQAYKYLIYKAGKSIQFSPNLGVLKFPSLWFPKAYANKSAALYQEKYLRQLEQNPAGLEHDVLLALAAAFTREVTHYGYEPWQMAAEHAARVAVYWLLHAYGRERWPLSLVMRRTFQQRRENVRLLRGLLPHNRQSH